MKASPSTNEIPAPVGGREMGSQGTMSSSSSSSNKVVIATPPEVVVSNEKSLSRTESGGGGRHHQFIFIVDQAPRTVVFFAAVMLSCLVLFHSASPLQLPAHYNPFSRNQSAISPLLKKKVDLESILKNAAMEDKTVVLTTLNDAWAEPNSMFDLFLESFRIGNQTQRFLNHLVVVALDQKAYARCIEVHPHCYNLSTAGIDFSGEAYFMAPDYLKMMWRRINFLRTVLHFGYNFIFTDADIMWFRDPFPRFHPKVDFQIACDYFRGNPSDLHNLPNGGFTFVKSNKKTIKFYKFWYNSKEKFPGLHDQDVLNKIKFDPFIREIGLKIRFLDTAYFGGFCQTSKDLNKVCTMHANCCVGLDNKVYDLEIMLDDWRKYMLSKANVTAPQHTSWTVPQHCGAASFRPRAPKKKGSEGSHR